MQVITNLNFKEDSYTLAPFLRKHFKPTIIPMMSHKVVGEIMNGRNMISAIEQLMSMEWRIMRMVGTMTTGQRTLGELEDDTRLSVHLLQNAHKDKCIIMVSGDNKVIHHIVIAYVGDEKYFDKYLEELNISKLEVYSKDNLIHYEEETEEGAV